MANDHDDNIQNTRREYGQRSLSITSALKDPMAQFKQWLNDAVTLKLPDPTAMVLATTDKEGYPDARVVLLKEMTDNSFVFFTNYASQKAKQLKSHDHAALLFYWSSLSRQVRVRGKVQKISAQSSDAYFTSRPINSQIAAIISKQSEVISSRASLDDQFKQAQTEYAEKKQLTRPDYWGGYELIPIQFEFWQGRDNRLHDRIRYCHVNNTWICDCLAP